MPAPSITKKKGKKMLNPYHEKIDIREILMLQNHQYQQILYFENEIPADTTLEGSVNVTGLGHFMLLSFTGDYTTKVNDEGEADDDGICDLSMQLIDGSSNRTLFDNLIPLNILLSPGRRQIIPGVGEYSNQLYLEFGFVYTFSMNGSIQVRIQNNADFANIVRIAFKGIRIFPETR
jgi:hypothetical protein